MTLGTKVIDLIRPDDFHDHREAGRVCQICVMKMQSITDRGIAGEQVVNALAIQATRAANQSVDIVLGLTEKELGKIRAVLAGDSCYEVRFM